MMMMTMARHRDIDRRKIKRMVTITRAAQAVNGKWQVANGKRQKADEGQRRRQERLPFPSPVKNERLSPILIKSRWYL